MLNNFQHLLIVQEEIM